MNEIRFKILLGIKSWTFFHLLYMVVISKYERKTETPKRIKKGYHQYLKDIFFLIHNIIAYQQQFTNFYSTVIFMKYCVICVSWEQYHTHKIPDEFNSYTYCPCFHSKEKVQFYYLLTSLSFKNILIYLSLIRKIKNPYNKLKENQQRLFIEHWWYKKFCSVFHHLFTLQSWNVYLMKWIFVSCSLRIVSLFIFLFVN